jgi:RNA polymerase sigma-70 factor (ECF subfamily)
VSAATVPGAGASAGAGPSASATASAVSQPRRASASADVTALVEREAPSLLAYFVRRVTVREDAADLLAELYLVVWRRRSAIPQQPDAARMWMYGVARKVLGRHRRSRGRRDALASRLREQLAAHPEPAVDDDSARRVRELVGTLAPLDREIVGLAYWEGFSFVEIATILGMPTATVRSRHARAKARMRAELEKEG